MLETPVLFIVFNRPDTTQKVFNKIREIQPKKLYITSDGPRENNAEDNVNCQLVRTIVNEINWDCDVKKLYADQNMGFSKRIKSALDWFYTNEEKGIILEDDCLPSTSFFKYCELMLEKHRDNEDIQVITGTNYCDHPISKKQDYFIADFGYIWGWASWRRVVQNIQWETNYSLKEVKDKLICVYQDEEYVNHFYSIVHGNYNIKDCWDVEFFVFNLMNNKKSIFPNVNLISNIGNSGTHYINSENKLLNIKTFEIDFNKFNVNNYIILPQKIKRKVIKEYNRKANYLTFRDKLYILKKQIFKILFNS